MTAHRATKRFLVEFEMAEPRDGDFAMVVLVCLVFVAIHLLKRHEYGTLMVHPVHQDHDGADAS